MRWLAMMAIIFFLYSLAGWTFECVYCSVSERRFINRGFLNGPYCPIYGAGGLLGALAFSPSLLGAAAPAVLGSPAIVFVAGSLLCCALEYAVSAALEAIYHARWWDYSERFLNLHGRVCLAGGLLFGAASLVVVYGAQPLLVGSLAGLPDAPVIALGVAVGVVMIGDLVVTHVGLLGFRRKVDAYCEQLTRRAQEAYAQTLGPDTPLAQRLAQARETRVGVAYARLRDALPSVPGPVAVEDLIASFASALNAQERRVTAAFPNLQVRVTSLSAIRDRVGERIDQLIRR